jgi:hypothetical protein
MRDFSDDGPAEKTYFRLMSEQVETVIVGGG